MRKIGELKLKIVTVNVPESYIDAINKLTGPGGLYPSRSELIRAATREFLLKELQMAKNMTMYDEPEFVQERKIIDPSIVRIPISTVNENNEPVREFTTYKILRRLE